jgi:hypothetical protein
MESRFEWVNNTFQSHRDIPVTKQQVLQVLGNNAVIVFIGDSNIRNTYESMLRYFEIDGWLDDIRNESSTWRGDMRSKVDHTSLCPLPSVNNITIVLLWNKFITSNQFYSSRMWSSCNGKLTPCLPTEHGMVHCDHSSQDGATRRWECGDLLNSVQNNLNESEQRKFIVISGGASHDVAHLLDRNNFEQSDHRINAFVDSMKSGFKTADGHNCWSTSHLGGKEILITPFKLQMVCPDRGGSWFCTKESQPGRDALLKSFRDHYIAADLVGTKTFDGLIDGYALTDESAGAPIADSDGIHYPTTVYDALVTLLWETIIDLYSDATDSVSATKG